MGMSIPLLVAGIVLLGGTIYGAVQLFSPHPNTASPKVQDNSTLSTATSIIEAVILLSTTLSPTTSTLTSQAAATTLEQFKESPTSIWVPDAQPTTTDEETTDARPTTQMEDAPHAPQSTPTALSTNGATISAVSAPIVVITKETPVPKIQETDVPTPSTTPTAVAQPSTPTTASPTTTPVVDKDHKDDDNDEEDEDEDEEEEEEEEEDEEEDDDAPTSSGPTHSPVASPSSRPQLDHEEEDEKDGDTPIRSRPTHSPVAPPSSIPQLDHEEDVLDEEWEVEEDADDMDDGVWRLKERLSQHPILNRSQMKKRQSDSESKGTATTTTSRHRASELDQWIDDTVDQQTAFYEGEVVGVIDELLQEIVSAPEGYRFEEVNLRGYHHHRQAQDQRLEQDTPPPSSGGKVSEPPPKPSAILTFVQSLARPFVLQLRADIRSVLLWICFGAPGSPIDGKVDGSSDFSERETINDRIATMHENGTLFIQDILDPNLVPLVLRCLRYHLDIIWTEIQSLFWTRVGQSKDFILEQVRSLIPLPRFLIPFSKEIEQGEMMIEIQEDENVGVEGTNGELSIRQQGRVEQEHASGKQKPEDAFAVWLVANVMNRLKINTEKRATIQKSTERRKARSRTREEVFSSESMSPGCEWLKDRIHS